MRKHKTEYERACMRDRYPQESSDHDPLLPALQLVRILGMYAPDMFQVDMGSKSPARHVASSTADPYHGHWAFLLFSKN